VGEYKLLSILLLRNAHQRETKDQQTFGAANSVGYASVRQAYANVTKGVSSTRGGRGLKDIDKSEY
jgi:hypothetical protein